MPLSTEVNLPRNHVAQYPNRCVVCGKHKPDSFVRIITSTMGWWLILLWWWWGWFKPFKTRVPACKRCVWRFHFRRFGSLAAVLLIAVIVMLYVWPHWQTIAPRFGKKYVAVGVIILFIVPVVLFDVFLPPRMDVSVFSTNVDYEFADAEYARDFAAMNKDADWVKLDGEPFEG